MKAAHTGAFTTLESKIDPTLGRPIISQYQLFEDEVLLLTLKRKFLLIYFYDAKIGLLIQDESDVATEIDTCCLLKR